MPSFNVSHSWFSSFKNTQGFQIVELYNEDVSTAEEAAKTFPPFLNLQISKSLEHFQNFYSNDLKN